MNDIRSCDDVLLSHCLNLAWEAQTLALPNPSVSALVLDSNGNILATATHIKAGSPHAEVLALRDAYMRLTNDAKILACESSADLHAYLVANHNNIFHQCSLYVSLEPCNHYGKTPPCAHLIAALKLKKVRFIAKDSTPNAANGAHYIKEMGIDIAQTSNNALQSAGDELLLPFLCMQKNGKFVLFKLAQKLDGSYKGRISCNEARVFTHNQRSMCDYICVSGKTFRSDSPKLNAREAKAPFDSTYTPKVLIISRQHIAESIPKHWRIMHDISELNALRGFIIIEGGFNLLDSIRSHIDMLLVHKAMFLGNLDSSTQSAESAFMAHNMSASFRLLHTNMLGRDLALWLQ